MLPDDPEGVVDDLLGELVPGREPHEKARQPPVIKQVELLHRGAVAAGDPDQQGAFALLARATACGS
jgi:hypothetical protein